MYFLLILIYKILLQYDLCSGKWTFNCFSHDVRVRLINRVLPVFTGCWGWKMISLFVATWFVVIGGLWPTVIGVFWSSLLFWALDVFLLLKVCFVTDQLLCCFIVSISIPSSLCIRFVNKLNSSSVIYLTPPTLSVVQRILTSFQAESLHL